MSGKKDAEIKNKHIALGLVFGMLGGAVLGEQLVGSTGTGIAVGMCFGICIGVSVAKWQKTQNRK